MTLDDAHRLAVYNAVQGVFNAVNTPTESVHLEEIVRAVLTTARKACANFSENWNRRVSNSLAQRLPPEVLAECLRASDFMTRVRASHVSRAWRATAIGDRSLWTTFSRTSFRDLEDQNAAFHQLETMVARSDPLPIRVQLPHTYYGECEDYEEALPSIIQDGILRIQEYSGPCWAFSEANYAEHTFTQLVSFSCLDPDDSTEDIDVSLYWSPDKMPNLQRLVGPTLMFQEPCDPLRALTTLCFYLSDDEPESYRDLFNVCPNLVSLDLRRVTESTPLPPGPLPASLEDVTLRSAPRIGGGGFEVPMDSWYSLRIPRLSFRRTLSLSTPISAFLAACDSKTVTLSLNSSEPLEVTLSAEGFCWVIERWGVSSWQFEDFDEMQPLVTWRVASMRVGFECLASLFSARMSAPLLVSLEITFAEVADMDDDAYLPVLPAHSSYYLHARNLQHLVVNVPDAEDDVMNTTDPRDRVLASLIQHFREFLRYDADKLETITLRCAEPDLVEHSGLAQFANQFIVES